MAGVRGGVFSRLAAGMTALRETAGRWADVLVLAAVAIACSAAALGLNAPPHGLYFVEARYPED